MKHELKTDREVFKAEWSGDKTYEIRFDDRQYAVLETVIVKNIRYAARNHDTNSEVVQRPGSVFSTGAAAEIMAPAPT